jgi:hypothetical protein
MELLVEVLPGYGYGKTPGDAIADGEWCCGVGSAEWSGVA